MGNFKQAILLVTCLMGLPKQVLGRMDKTSVRKAESLENDNGWYVMYDVEFQGIKKGKIIRRE